MTISATESIGVSFWATEFLGGIGLYGLDGLFLLTDFTDYLFWASVFTDFLFWHWTLRHLLLFRFDNTQRLRACSPEHR